jgi:AcrR family transcriptional regulator
MTIVAAPTEVRYREIARRLMNRESPKDIAEALGITPGTLYWHLRQQAFRDILREVDEQVYKDVDRLIGNDKLEVTQRVAEAQNEAFDELLHLMRYGKGERTRLNASQDILDRGGTIPKAQPQVSKVELREISVKMLVVALGESTKAEITDGSVEPSRDDTSGD